MPLGGPWPPALFQLRLYTPVLLAAFLCFFLVISWFTAPEPSPEGRLVFPGAGGWDMPLGENACVSRASSGRVTVLRAEPGVREPAACVKVSVNRSAHSTGSARPPPSRWWPGAGGPGPAFLQEPGAASARSELSDFTDTTTSNGEDGRPSAHVCGVDHTALLCG